MLLVLLMVAQWQASSVPAQVFEGTQRVSRLESRAGEDWRVEVVLQVCASCATCSGLCVAGAPVGTAALKFAADITHKMVLKVGLL